MPRLPRIPDLITTANLSCGGLSILFASQGQLTLACWLVFAGALFDVFDGLAARALGGGTPLGAQLDSLADMVTFGMAPAFVLFVQSSMLAGNLVDPSALPALAHLPYPNLPANWPIKTAALALIIASCWRLAKFNLDTRQTSGFLGLPTPANGLFWVSVVLTSQHDAVHPGPGAETLAGLASGLLANATALLVLSGILSMLMLSELPLPSFKFKRLAWRGNEVIFLLLGTGSALVILYGVGAVPLILLLYLLSPLWGKPFPKQTA